MAQIIESEINPIISVIVPCYNQAKYLSEALQSVLDQSFTNWECIIINDGSTDNSEEVALQWVNKDKRFKYFHKTNSGVADTRNYGIKNALGQYIIPLDGDDKLDPEYFQSAVNVFENKPSTKLVYSNVILFGKINKEIIIDEFQFKKELYENQIFNSSFYKKEDFLKTIGYNPNMVYGNEDWDFYLSLIGPKDEVVKLNGFHYYYRINESSRSTEVNNNIEVNKSQLLQMFKNHTPLFLEYFNPIRDHIEADYYKKEVKTLQNSWEYKIGKVITYPFRLINKILKKLG